MHLPWQILFFILEISLVLPLDFKGKRKEHKVCKSKYCRDVAEAIIKSRNTAVNPCKNFYEYACGSWNKYKPIPSYDILWSQSDVLQENIYTEIKDLLLEKIHVSDIPSTKAMKQLYRSCLDIRATKTADINAIAKILDETGGWPAAMPLKSWNPDGKSWQKIDQHYFKFIGRSIFFEIDYETDLTNTQDVIISIKPNSDIPWTSKINLAEKTKAPDSYKNTISHVISLFAQKDGHTLDESQLIKDVNDMVAFENKLLTMIPSDQFKKWQVANTDIFASQEGTKVDVFESLKSAYQTVGITFKPGESFIIYNHEFYNELGDYLDKVPLRVIVNYIQWNMVFLLLTYSTPDLWKLKFNTIYSEFNVKNYPPRWLSCIHDLNLRDATSYLFVKQNVARNALQDADTLAQKVQIEVQGLAASSKDLANDMKVFMLQKIFGIRRELGYPKWYRDQTNIMQEYKDLKMGKEYFLNALTYKRFEFKRFLKLYRGNIEKTKWRIQPTQINAYYSGRINTIFVPASYMQPPVFTSVMPDAFNFGTFGVIVGHEFSHAIGSKSIWFDKNVHLKLWANDDLDMYKLKEKCFLDQYNNLPFPLKDSRGNDVKLNGPMILDENLADNIGIKASYLAFKKVQSHRQLEMKLPGLESLSGDELFFLSFAHSGCQTIRPEYEKYVYKNDIHGPMKFRIMSSLANMREFAETYKCPVGSPMNPAKKCNLLL